MSDLREIAPLKFLFDFFMVRWEYLSMRPQKWTRRSIQITPNACIHFIKFTRNFKNVNQHDHILIAHQTSSHSPKKKNFFLHISIVTMWCSITSYRVTVIAENLLGIFTQKEDEKKIQNKINENQICFVWKREKRTNSERIKKWGKE